MTCLQIFKHVSDESIMHGVCPIIDLMATIIQTQKLFVFHFHEMFTHFQTRGKSHDRLMSPLCTACAPSSVSWLYNYKSIDLLWLHMIESKGRWRHCFSPDPRARVRASKMWVRQARRKHFLLDWIINLLECVFGWLFDWLLGWFRALLIFDLFCLMVCC